MEDIIFSAKQVQGKKALFGKGRFALQNVDFELPSGYIMGIIGENGAGKTTFFRYIMEEKKHYHGSFYLDGTDIAEDHAWSMNRIGFVSEERLFLRQKSARENARMLGSFYDTFDMDRFAALMEQMDLTMARTVEQMSRGENVKLRSHTNRGFFFWMSRLRGWIRSSARNFTGCSGSSWKCWTVP